MSRVAPVMYEASGLARNKTPAAISSGLPIRPSGTDPMSRCAALPAAVLSCVATSPVCSRLTVMPLAARSRAAPRVNPASYLFPYTRKSFSPATGLYSPSCRAFIPFSHASFFDEVWNVVSPTNLLWVGLSMMLFPL